MSFFTSNTSKPLFSTTTSSSNTLFNSNQATSGPLFGSSTTPQPSFGFNLQATPAKPALPTSMSFASTTKPSLFGTPANTTTSSPFNFQSTLTTAKSSAPSLFNSTPTFSFKTPTTTSTGSLFSQPIANASSATSGFSLTQPAQHSTISNPNVEAFYSSLSQPLLLGDERDSIVAKWNQIQAMYGTGIGYCALGPVNYTPENAFCRFKSIAFNMMPKASDADGLVRLKIARPLKDLLSQQQNIKDFLFRALGNKPHISIEIEDIRAASKDSSQSEIVIKVKDRQSSTNPVTISSNELVAYLCTNQIATQLQNQMAVVDVSAEVAPSTAQLSSYFDTPPAGFDKLVWQQFRLDNPAPESLIPVPLIGLEELKMRKIDQTNFASQQNETINKLAQNAKDMRGKQLLIKQKIFELKRKEIELSHRILKYLACQEVNKKSGFAITPEEETLRYGLERLWSELLLSPQGLRNRVQELMNNSSAFEKVASNTALESNLNLDEDTRADLKEYLGQRTTAINEMRLMLNEASEKIKTMLEYPPENVTTNQSECSPFSRNLSGFFDSQNKKVSFA